MDEKKATLEQKPFQAKHFLHSVRFAIQGLRQGFRSEPNLKIQTGLALAALGAGAYYRLARWEWLILLLCIGLMMAVELLNTAIEHLVDGWVGHIVDERAAHVKDIAAGACLLTAVTTAVIGLILFLPHFY